MHPHKTLQIFAISLAALFAVGWVNQYAGAQIPDRETVPKQIRTTPNDNSGQVNLVIPTTDGRLVWKEVALSLAEALKLDGPTVEKIFPTGSLDLNSSATVLVLFGVDVALGDAVSIAMIRDDHGDPALRLRCDRNAIRFLSSKHQAKQARLHFDDDWKTRTNDRPLVLCLHGLKSDHHRFDDFREFLRSTGYATAAVVYDDHQSMVTSAEQVSQLVGKSLGERPRTKLVLVGHSMGGLVAREWVENPRLENHNIVALITAGTPHRGSNWATLPPLLDLFADRKLDAAEIVDVLLHQPSAAGMRELAPDSDFLTKLQSRPTREDVQYTTIAGTESPVTEEEVIKLRTTLRELNEKSTTLRLLQPRIRPLLNSFDELADGKGDGVVSIERATINGVDDVVAVEVTHFDFFRRPRAGRDQPVWRVIEARLNRVAERIHLP